MSDSTYDPVAGITWGVVSGGQFTAGAVEREAEHVVVVNGDDFTGGGAPPAGGPRFHAPVPVYTYLGGSKSQEVIGAYDDLGSSFSSVSTDVTTVWNAMVESGYGALMSAPGFPDPGAFVELHDADDNFIDATTPLNSHGVGYRWIAIVSNVAMDMSIAVSIKFLG